MESTLICKNEHHLSNLIVPWMYVVIGLIIVIIQIIHFENCKFQLDMKNQLNNVDLEMGLLKTKYSSFDNIHTDVDNKKK